MSILIAYTILSAGICIGYGFVCGSVPPLVPGFEVWYKLCNGLLVFFRAVPAVIFTGFTIGAAISFGRKPDGSVMRFSPAMFKRYRWTLVVALICVFLLAAVNEIGIPLVNSSQQYSARMPAMVHDYVTVGHELCSRGEYQLARQYVQQALTLSPDDDAANELQQRIDIETAALSSGWHSVSDMSPAASAGAFPERASVYELLQRAERAAEQQDWFQAHYCAETALAIASPRDINRQRLLALSAEAWNMLSAPRFDGETAEQEIFAKKREGYTALMNDDILHAYYVFRTLSLRSRALSVDRDVVRYLAIAEARLKKEYFFIDEQSFTQRFESARDVYCALPYHGGTRIIFVKGITNAADANTVVQYLRNFSLFDLDKDGNYTHGLFVPYAKLAQVHVGEFDEDMRAYFDIASGPDTVPSILLSAVDRDDEHVMMTPLYYRADGLEEVSPSNRIFLPISYADYLLLVAASQGAEVMGLEALYRFAPRAAQFGFSEEVYVQVLMDRLLYPLFMLILLLLLASYAWNNKIQKTSPFKFKWVLMFPLFTVLFYHLYNLCLWCFKLTNYAVIGIVGTSTILYWCIGVYVVLFALVSCVFLSRNDT
ncbi:MAG: hypothetical protein IJ191_07385 [Treponema sp.]|nr:hypothetical protein [Treponema sp.]